MRCNDCTRTDLLRAAAARAGSGLPGIEAGMPLPAGTGMSRRRFLARSAGLALAVYGGSRIHLPGLDEGIAQAAAGPAQPVLVSVFLEGGADALSVLFPAGDPLYKKLRPKLRPTRRSPKARPTRARKAKMKVNVQTLDAGKGGDLELKDEIFGVEPRADILHRVVTWQLTNRRAPARA